MANAGESQEVQPSSSAVRRGLAGSLDEVDIFSLAQFLVIQRKTGVLAILYGDIKATLRFENGQILNGSFPGAPDGLEAVRRAFRLKEGGFEFLPASDKVPALITTDAQSLLMDLAIETDEMNRTVPAQDAAPPPPVTPPSGMPSVHPAVVRVVRPAAASPPPLAARMGAPPAAPVSSSPAFTRRAFSQDEFIRQIEERLDTLDTEFPSRARDVLRRQSRIARPSRRLPVSLAMLGVPIVLVAAGIIAWLATRTSTPVAASPSPSPQRPVVSSPSAAKAYTFVTSTKSPARVIEQGLVDIPLRCNLKTMAFDRKDVRQVDILLLREAFWDKNELATAIAQDSVALVKRIFDTQPSIERVSIIVKSRLSREGGQEELEEVFKMVAGRQAYVAIKETYDLMSPLVILGRFDGRFSAKLVEP